jgi:predicted ATPase
MRIDKLAVRGFRNLGDFSVEFDQSQFATVLIGENGTGKSNLIEALVLIFRQLDSDLNTSFGYELVYLCRNQRIRVAAEARSRPTVFVGPVDDERRLSWNQFEKLRDELLPRYVFAYYSGPSPRLRQYFDYHQTRYYNQVVNDESGEAPPIRRLFYCLPEHSRWVLLAYFLRGSETPPFLRRFFEIEGFDSALLVLKKPYWARNWSSTRLPPERIRRKGDERFWWSRGVVKTFLQRLWDETLAPIRVIEDYQEDYRLKPVKEEHLYLYLPAVSSLQRLNDLYLDEASLFAALESTEISHLVRDVRVRVMRDGQSVVFSELSEGEQQLLTVVGLMQFTRHDESLFLLDEPDTHLNPKWKLRYLNELAIQTGLATLEEDSDTATRGLDQTSQLILATHDPLTIAGLEGSQVLIFERLRRGLRVHRPDEDPRGMGVVGVLIRLFGLPSTLDSITQNKIDERNRLLRMEARSSQEEQDLSDLTVELSELGLAYDARDPEYRRYLRALHRWEVEQQRELQELPLDEQDAIVDQILADLMSERG